MLNLLLRGGIFDTWAYHIIVNIFGVVYLKHYGWGCCVELESCIPRGSFTSPLTDFGLLTLSSESKPWRMETCVRSNLCHELVKLTDIRLWLAFAIEIIFKYLRLAIGFNDNMCPSLSDRTSHHLSDKHLIKPGSKCKIQTAFILESSLIASIF